MKKFHPQKRRTKNPQITRWRANNKTYPGFCHNPNHIGYMTIDAMCKHECLQKKCLYFEALEEHNLWFDDGYTNNKLGYKKTLKLKQLAKKFITKKENYMINNMNILYEREV